MSSSKVKWLMPALLCILAFGICSTARADIVCDFQLQTTYAFGPTRADSLGGGTPSPDTGAAVIADTGGCKLAGDFSTVANRQGGATSDGFSAVGVTWNPTDTHSIEIGPESSNQGGYNGPFGSIQPGVEMIFSGTVSFGADSALASFDVFDRDVHSGVARSGCGGISSDSYVLQGGAPTGCDNGDSFETTQATGIQNFEVIIHTGAAVPEPGSIMLLGTTLGALGLAGWRWKRTL